MYIIVGMFIFNKQLPNQWMVMASLSFMFAKPKRKRRKANMREIRKKRRDVGREGERKKWENKGR